MHHIPDEVLLQILERVPRKKLASLAFANKQFFRCTASVYHDARVKAGMIFGYKRYPQKCPGDLLRVLEIYPKGTRSTKPFPDTWVKVQGYWFNPTCKLLRACGPVMRKKVCKRPSGALYVSSRVKGSDYRSKFDLYPGFERFFTDCV